MELARLSRHADPHTGLVAKSRPELQELADEFGESVFLFLHNAGGGLHMVVRSIGSRALDDRLPLHATSSGRVLLAEMPEDKAKALLPEHLEAYTARTITKRAELLDNIRLVGTQGFGIVDNELEEGLISLSQPVRDSSGTLVAILTVDSRRGLDVGAERSVDDAVQRMNRTVNNLAGTFWPDTPVTD